MSILERLGFGPKTPATPPAAAPATPPEPQGADKYKELWTPVEPPKDEPVGFSSVDPTKIMEASRQVDFTKGIPPELTQQISAGGEGALAAMTQMMNLVAQQAYGNSAIATTKIVDQAVQQAMDRMAAKMPEMMRTQQSRNELLQANPAFTHPAIAPLVEAQMSQMAAKFPKASPAELKQMSLEYLQGAAALISPPVSKDSQAPKANPNESGWGTWMGLPSQ